MGLTFALIWSSAFTSARIIVTHAPPLAASAVRFFIAGVIAIALARALGQTWSLTRAQWRATFVFGLCQNALYLGLNFVAMQSIEASLAAIIASTMPLLVAFLGWTIFRERLAPLALIGLCAGFGGVALIMSARLSAGVDLSGLALCLIGAFALAVATLTMRHATTGGNVLMIIGLQMLVGAGTLGLASVLTETLYLKLTPSFLIAFAYTTLVAGLVATWIWFALVARIGATRAASFHFLNPFFGVAIAALILGESLGWRDVLGVLIVMAGILAVQHAQAKQASETAKQRP